jgi:hypothetical protein
VALTIHSHPVLRLKKEQSYTPTPLGNFVVCSRVRLSFTVTAVTFGSPPDKEQNVVRHSVLLAINTEVHT